MNGILVDTSVWSLAFRKRTRNANEEMIAGYLAKIIRDFLAIVIGPIRQELLSGIPDSAKYEELREKMTVFPDYQIHTVDYELAARFHNECRKNGVQGSHIDFLICAVAHNNDFAIFTLDNDFSYYEKYIKIEMIKPQYLDAK
jgi:predicted nucleic acid-binding protein